LGAPQTFTETVTATICGKKHVIAEKIDVDYTRECMSSKGDWTYGLVVGDQVYALRGDAKQLDSFAGKHLQTDRGKKPTTVLPYKRSLLQARTRAERSPARFRNPRGHGVLSSVSRFFGENSESGPEQFAVRASMPTNRF